mmetsp:Transcript_93056/g.161763  ORF Transcript_93056/g.161763 Transcript_93056/m.161763 type:complete len:234 (-) Transcript_93056:864-1565(-)
MKHFPSLFVFLKCCIEVAFLAQYRTHMLQDPASIRTCCHADCTQNIHRLPVLLKGFRVVAHLKESIAMVTHQVADCWMSGGIGILINAPRLPVLLQSYFEFAFPAVDVANFSEQVSCFQAVCSTRKHVQRPRFLVFLECRIQIAFFPMHFAHGSQNFSSHGSIFLLVLIELQRLYITRKCRIQVASFLMNATQLVHQLRNVVSCCAPFELLYSNSCQFFSIPPATQIDEKTCH